MSGDPGAGLPDPVPIVAGDSFTVRLSGIGGTGVITVSQILGTAAMLDGFVVRGLDQTGLSQKAGPVVSDLRLSRGDVPASNHASSAGVDCLLAFDLLVAASDTHRVGAGADRTVVVGSTAVTPTGAMVAHPTTPYPNLDVLTGRLDEVSRREHNRYLDAAGLAAGLFGEATTANILLLGVAVQQGAIAVDPVQVERAIELNGVAVARNVAALRWGRRWAVAPDEVARAAGVPAPVAPETLDELIERLAHDLVDYQSAAYADRFRQLVDVAREAEQRVDRSSTAFTEAVARYGHKLMAYKDEYEVARLLLAPEARQGYEAVGGPGTKVTWRLHPPMLRALGMKEKLRLGPRSRPLLVALARGKRLRGTLADPFRWAEVRRVERALIPEYERTIRQVAARLSVENLPAAVQLASLPDHVRGYEDLKLTRAATYRAELEELLKRFRAP
jgi:indolepyruvate ferredoxin oxidoreductase